MAGGLGRKNKVNTPATDRPSNTRIRRNNSIMAGGLGRKNKVNTPATDRPANTGVSRNNSIMAGGLGRKNNPTLQQQIGQLMLVSA